MRLRLVLSIVALLALVAGQPCFAKEWHAQHGPRPSASNSGAGGKGASSANPMQSKANVPIDAEGTVAPPVLPPHRPLQQPGRDVNQTIKIVTPANTARGQAGALAAPTTRNAIGQPVAPPKNFVGAQPPVLALQKPGTVPPTLHGAPTAPPVVSSSAANAANAANAGTPSANATLSNHGSVNGATVIQPATTPSVIGGPARPRYGINGTTVQKKH
jgi:hypothetical protein